MTRQAPTDRRKAKAAEPLVRLHGVDLYRDYRLVLRDVDWTIRRGEHWAIWGRNGSGKSSLLKMLYGDLHPKLGGVIERNGVLLGTPIAEWKRRVGFVSPELQAEYFLARDLEEVVISGRYSSIGLNDTARRDDRKAARSWLKFFGLSRLADRKPRAVSYGQMRLALLARAMINQPELLLLDEPCTGLDPKVRAIVLAMLAKLASGGVQLVIAVHDRADVPPCVKCELHIERPGTVRIASRRAIRSAIPPRTR
jgi:molybdate transport system ATP-binding protein